jgi:DMSO/TMAO reductase YedYZ molybdopterin-dependent catalytic subunit
MFDVSPAAHDAQPDARAERLVERIRRLQRSEPAIPIYVHVERSVRMLVADGSYSAGQRLPSVRDLARRLGLATNTVTRAYAALVDDAIVDARAGGGSVVTGRQPALASDTADASGRERLQRAARHLVAYLQALGHSPAEVVHAGRAELAAFGRDMTHTVPRVEVRAHLPTHAVPLETHMPETHALEIAGLVTRPRRLGPSQLARFPRSVLQEPFVCDQGWMVAALRWAGVPVGDILEQAQPLAEAKFVRVCAGPYTVPVSLAEVREALLANELDGKPLAAAHGAPWRLVVPGGACYSSVKWVDRLEQVDEPGARSITRA